MLKLSQTVTSLDGFQGNRVSFDLHTKSIFAYLLFEISFVFLAFVGFGKSQHAYDNFNQVGSWPLGNNY